MENKVLSEREIRRFQPQIKLEGFGLEGQKKIKKSRVLVIGAGGKGTACMKALIGAGVGFLGVSDDSLVQETTLSRQSLYNDNDIGKQKAIVTKQYLQARNRLTDIKVHNIRLTSENLNKTLSQYDLIVDATNTFSSHYAICEASAQANKTLVFGHIGNNKGYITTILPENKKRIRQIFPDENNIDGNIMDEHTPVIAINSLSGIILANEVINAVLEKPSQLNNNLLIIKLSDYSFNLQAV